MDPDKVVAALETQGKHLSVDAPLAEDDNTCLLDLLPNHDNTQSDPEMSAESLVAEVDRALHSLPTREEMILRMSYGIKAPELCIEEIARRMHLSRERVRQIREKGLALLRTANVGNILRCFL